MTASRKPVRVRPGTVEDLPFLLQLGEELKATRALTAQRLTDAITAAIADPDRQLVLAVAGPDDAEERLGMALFSLGSANPLLDIPAVNMSHTVVGAKHRRRVPARRWWPRQPRSPKSAAIDQLVISVDPGSRESARFFARLGFVPLAVRRTAPVATVRREAVTRRF